MSFHSQVLLAGVLAGFVLPFPRPAVVPSRTGSIEGIVRETGGAPIRDARVAIEGTSTTARTDSLGRYRLAQVAAGKVTVRVVALGYNAATQPGTVTDGLVAVINFTLTPAVLQLDEIVVAATPPSPLRRELGNAVSSAASPTVAHKARADFNTEEYHAIAENAWKSPLANPLSTFSSDVDAASYSNVRRYLIGGSLPPRDAVRVEEMINYFRYDYPDPRGSDPVSITTEVSPAPWSSTHKLMLVGLQTRRIEMKDLPPNNLVFLLDVSGSMQAENKLPLVKQAFRLLVDQLRPQDRVSIAVYAGAAGLVLPPTPGSRKEEILAAIQRLEAGGTTAGAAGIRLAYQTAHEAKLAEGNNRVILATDGDFNVGTSSDSELTQLIEKERERGISLTVLGFGMGNYKDSKLELLADKGNGNYAYIDNINEARKVFVRELGATLMTVAKDVKLQVEFNPARVAAYRLVGYENRVLANEDFNDDRKDAGDMGAGHSVTALYEIVPTGVPLDVTLGKVDQLKYQKESSSRRDRSGDWATVKIRYKQPEGGGSKLFAREIRGEREVASENFRWATAVAGIGMLLRDSEHKGTCSWPDMIALAREARGEDEDGYRAEFVRLSEVASKLSRR
jgi:Ca-activated chloride channel family protein